MTERKRVMTDYRNDTEERELLEERRKLSLERIRQIPEESFMLEIGQWATGNILLRWRSIS